jgi:hypothetical protein
MRKIEYYIAFDEEKFETEEECLTHEKESVLSDQTKIIFYDDFGFPTQANEDTLLNANCFISFSLEGLQAYIKFCSNLGITAPHIPEVSDSYPQLHFVFGNKKWNCIEELEEQCKEYRKCFSRARDFT